jgi:starch synthase
MKILMISTEVTPFAKTGGLGDVVGALSKELAGLGHEVRVVCPLYGFLKPGPAWRPFAGVVSVHLGFHREEFCRVWQAPLPGSAAEVNFIEFHRYFGRAGIYSNDGEGYTDNAERFVFLTRAALDWCRASDWIPTRTIGPRRWHPSILIVWTALGRWVVPRASSPSTTSNTRATARAASSISPVCLPGCFHRTTSRASARSTS